MLAAGEQVVNSTGMKRDQRSISTTAFGSSVIFSGAVRRRHGDLHERVRRVGDRAPRVERLVPVPSQNIN
jgi:hypothetical protein